jgi:hypothetical protein
VAPTGGRESQDDLHATIPRNPASRNEECVLHLCSIRGMKKDYSKIPVISIARTRYRETLCSLFSIDGRFPKLNVAGSIPVSRSKKFSKLRIPLQ